MFLITITMTVLGLIFIRPLLTVLHTPVALRKQIGGTMYVVRVHFNEDAKETMKDKIKRLIENDVRGTQHTA